MLSIAAARRAFAICRVLAVVILSACSQRPAIGTPSPSAARFSDSEPPAVIGIRLGAPLEEVHSALGIPTSRQTLPSGAEELVYGKRGLVLVVTPSQGVGLIGLVDPHSPEIGSVRVGDPINHMIEVWGAPHRQVLDRLGYNYGSWGILVLVDTVPTPNRIRRMTVGWSSNGTTTRLAPPWPEPRDTTYN